MSKQNSLVKPSFWQRIRAWWKSKPIKRKKPKALTNEPSKADIEKEMDKKNRELRQRLGKIIAKSVANSRKRSRERERERNKDE